MKRVVISQPMFFPWVGLFEQIKLADAFVHYDDVQFSKGSFTNRVQIKTPRGTECLTVPLRDLRIGHPINYVLVDYRQNWQRQHLASLAHAYARAPFKSDLLSLVTRVYDVQAETIGELAVASVHEMCRYLSLADPDEFLYSSRLQVGGQSWSRVLDIVRLLDGEIGR